MKYQANAMMIVGIEANLDNCHVEYHADRNSSRKNQPTHPSLSRSLTLG